MSTDVIRATEQAWRTNPAQAQGAPAVKARIDGNQTVLEAGTFSWRTDLPPALGGANQAPSPTAQLLGALAGCAVAFIRHTLAPQLGVRVDAITATARCETDSRGLLGIDGVAPDLKNLELDIEIASPDPAERVQQLYETWQQRCPIYLALLKPMTVTTALHRA